MAKKKDKGKEKLDKEAAGQEEDLEKLFVDILKEESDFSKPILYASIGIAVIMVIIALLNFLDVIAFSDAPSEDPLRRMISWLVYAGAVVMGPYPFYIGLKQSKVKAIERRLPEFLRDVSEAGRFGMTLSEAIIVASTGRYGELTPEIKRMAAQIEWGVPASVAINRFAKRIGTPTVERVATIIIKANDAGGAVVDVLSMVAHDTREEQHQMQERAITMSTYIAVVYISFFVFLATIIILNATFLPQMLSASQSMASGAEVEGGGSPLAQNLPEIVDEIQLAFLVAVIIHAIGDGLLAGVLVQGEFAPGFMHATIMLIVGRVSFLLTPYVAPLLV